MLREIAQAHHVDDGSDAARFFRGVDIRLPQAEFDVFAHVEPGKAGILLEHDADAVGNILLDRPAFEFDHLLPLGAARPAINSSSVDLPQPDGPTTAKNSPFLISRSIGPSACTACPPAPAGKTFVTPRSVTCAADNETILPDRGGSIFTFLRSSGRKLGVDDLRQIDVAGQRADALLHLDDALHAIEMDVALAPIGTPSVMLVVRFLIALSATSFVMLKGLAMISAAWSGCSFMNCDRAAAGADDGADEVATRLCRFAGHDADDVVERRQRFGAGNQHAIFVLVLATIAAR